MGPGVAAGALAALALLMSACQRGERGDTEIRTPAGVRDVRPPGAIDSEPDCFVMVDAEPDFGSAPLAVRFSTEASCTAAPITYEWDFGDGGRGGDTPHPSHTYESPGEYVAIVRVTSPDGGESDDEIEIAVDAAAGR